MVALQISEALAAKLETFAKIEHKPLEAVLEEMAARYQPELPPMAGSPSENESPSLDDFIGMVEADVTDLSVRAREELHAIFKAKHDRSD